MRKSLIVGAALIVLIAFGALQSLRRLAAQNKYPVGTSMQQAINQLRLPYYVQTNAEDSLGWRYLVIAQKDGLVMEFGQDQRLTSVKLYTDTK